MTQSPSSAFDWRKYKADTLSGITVSLALVPEAVAFASWPGCIRWSGCMPRLSSVSSPPCSAGVRA